LLSRPLLELGFEICQWLEAPTIPRRLDKLFRAHDMRDRGRCDALGHEGPRVPEVSVRFVESETAANGQSAGLLEIVEGPGQVSLEGSEGSPREQAEG